VVECLAPGSAGPAGGSQEGRQVPGRDRRVIGRPGAPMQPSRSEAAKKRDWLRASTAPNPENIAASEVPVPFLHRPLRVRTAAPSASHLTDAGRPGAGTLDGQLKAEEVRAFCLLHAEREGYNLPEHFDSRVRRHAPDCRSTPIPQIERRNRASPKAGLHGSAGPRQDWNCRRS